MKKYITNLLKTLMLLFFLCFGVLGKAEASESLPFFEDMPADWVRDGRTVSYTVNSNGQSTITCKITEKKSYDDDAITYYVIPSQYVSIQVQDEGGEVYDIPGINYQLTVEPDPENPEQWCLAGIWEPEKYYPTVSSGNSLPEFFKDKGETIRFIAKEETPPPLDDLNYWVISVDDSQCTMEKEAEDRVPEVTIRSRTAGDNGEYVELEENVDFTVTAMNLIPTPDEENVIRISQISTSKKCGAILSDKGYIERDYQVYYLELSDYYRISDTSDEIFFNGALRLPTFRGSSSQYTQTTEYLSGYGYSYLEPKTEIPGRLPQISDSGQISAELWNTNGFLKVSYLLNGVEYQNSSEAAKAWEAQPTDTITVKVSVNDTYGSKYWLGQDTHTRRLQGSISKEYHINAYNLSETTSTYPYTELVGEYALFARVNPEPVVIAGESYSDVQEQVVTAGTYDGTPKIPTFTLGIYHYGEFQLGGLPGFVAIDYLTGITTESSIIKEIQYSGNINAGEGTMTILFDYPFTGSITRNFTIEPKSIADSSITVAVNDDGLYYTGKELLPKLTVKDTAIGTTLKEGEDYQIAVVSGGAQPGTASLKITGINNYAGEQSNISYEIQSPSLADGKTFDIEVSSVGYTGSAVLPTVTITDKRSGSVVAKGAYTVAATAGADNTNAGKGNVTITGKAPYSGTVKKEFTISRKDLGSAGTVTITAENVAYNGRAQLPKVTVKDNARGTVLTQNVDYVLTSAGDNTQIGTGKAKVSGIGNYRGSQTVEFNITEGALGDTGTYEVTVGSVTYNGTAQLPAVTVTDTSTGKTLVQGADYTVAAAEGADNVNAGTGLVSVTGVSLGGTVVKGFTINPKPLDDSIAVTASATVYNGKELLPAVTVTDQTLNKQLQESVDFFVAAEQGADNVNVGTGKAVVTGIGNYTGTKSVSFTIEEAKTPSTGDQDDGNTSADSNFSKHPFIVTVRNQRSLRLVWEKREGYDGYQLYMATRRGGTYKRIATTSRNTAAARKLTAGTTYYFKVRAYKTVNGKRKYTAFTKAMAVSTKLTQPKFTSAKSQKKGRVTLKWKRDSKAAGYRIYVKKAGSSKFKFVRDLTGNRRTTYTLKGLKSKKYVSVRIRSFKTVNGERLYSPLSKTIRIRVK